MFNYSNNERLVLVLLYPYTQWDDTVFNHWITYALAEDSALIDKVRKLLHSASERDPPIRPMDISCEDAFNIRKKQIDINTVTLEELLETDLFYEGKTYQGFVYKDNAFRDWHFVTHDIVKLEMLISLIKNTRKTHLQWIYCVTASGKKEHTHGLLSFEFARPLSWVSSFLAQAGITNTTLAPIHTDFGMAKRYLDKQKIGDAFEYGDRPMRRIYRDGVQAISTEENDATADGDTTANNTDRGEEAMEALRSWISKHKKTSKEFICNPTNMQINQKKAEYTGRVFVLDFKQVISGFTKEQIPEGWFGEEIVFLKNIPTAECLYEHITSYWLSAVPVIMFSFQNTNDEKELLARKDFCYELNKFN